MGILLAFTPFITFAVLDRFVGTTVALIFGAAVAVALVVYGVVIQKQSVKVLEVGTLVLFLALAGYSATRATPWSAVSVRLCVDWGLFLIVLGSVLIRRPFTLQYAREQVPPEVSSSPEFLRTNLVISAAWAGAFLAIVGFDVVLVFNPKIPLAAGIAVSVVALFGALRFTEWYPKSIGERTGA